MQRRSFIALLAAAPAALAACGSDGTSLPPADTAGPIDEPEPDAPVDSDPTEPADAGERADVVLALTYEGGFTTREFAFQNPPAVIITGDGRAISAAVTTAQFPGPMLPQHMVQNITPAGIDAVLAAADDAGLFAELDLDDTGELAIADASTTKLVLESTEGSVAHEAYALGIGGGPGESGESQPDRQALLGFVEQLQGDLAAVAGSAELDAPEPYVAEAVQITVMSLAGVDLGADATIVDWPESGPVRLDDPAIVDTFGCVEITDEAIVDLITASDQLTYFRQSGAATPDDVFQVIARPAYPGRACDA